MDKGVKECKLQGRHNRNFAERERLAASYSTIHCENSVVAETGRRLVRRLLIFLGFQVPYSHSNWCNSVKILWWFLCRNQIET